MLQVFGRTCCKFLGLTVRTHKGNVASFRADLLQVSGFMVRTHKRNVESVRADLLQAVGLMVKAYGRNVASCLAGLGFMVGNHEKMLQIVGQTCWTHKRNVASVQANSLQV